MLTVEELIGTGPGSINDVIKVAPPGVKLDENKTQGRKHRELLVNMLTAITAKLPDPQQPPLGVKWLNQPTITVNGTSVTVSAGSAEWPGISEPVQYAGRTFETTLAASPFQRVDTVYALSDGTYGYRKGPEGMTGIDPTLPANALPVGNTYWKSTGGSTSASSVTPQQLTDAVTVTLNGSISPNGTLNLGASPAMQNLAFVNTQAGGDYRVVINGCAGQTITITPVSGVVYTDQRGNVRETLPLPASGKCVVLYYHESATVRQVVVLDGKAGEVTGDYLPLAFLQEHILNAGGFDFGHAHSVANDGNGNSYESTLRTFNGIPYEEITKTLPNGDTAYLKEDVYGEYAFPVKTYRITVGGVTYEARQMLSWIAGVFAAGWEIQAGATTYSLKLHHDGKLYLNGVEFTGGGGTSMPLYTGTGPNTDGPMTQKAASDALALKISTNQVEQVPVENSTKLVSSGGLFTEIANAKNRANHTGSQAISTITNLTTELANRPTNTEVSQKIALEGNAAVKGTATPTLNPGTPTSPAVYMTAEAGTYTYFGNKVVPVNSFAVFSWNMTTSAWDLSVSQISLEDAIKKATSSQARYPFDMAATIISVADIREAVLDIELYNGDPAKQYYIALMGNGYQFDANTKRNYFQVYEVGGSFVAGGKVKDGYWNVTAVQTGLELLKLYSPATGLEVGRALINWSKCYPSGGRRSMSYLESLLHASVIYSRRLNAADALAMGGKGVFGSAATIFTKYPSIVNAIEKLELYGADPLKRYYLKYFGRNYNSSGNWYITVEEEGKNSTLGVCTYRYPLSENPTGVNVVELADESGSGITGKVWINWNKVTDVMLGANYISFIVGESVLNSSVHAVKQSTGNNPWVGKKLVALGDSITWGFVPRNDPSGAISGTQLNSYAKLVAQDLGMSFVNHGISGSTLGSVDNTYPNSPFTQRFQNLPDDADVVMVKGGTNDIRKNVLLGTMTDRTEFTFYGALHVLCEKLLKKYRHDQTAATGQNKTILFLTPIKNGPDVNTLYNGKTFKDYANAVKEVCAYYSIPVLDMYNESGMNPHILRTLQGTEPGYTDLYNPYLPDGTHPSQEGHRVMANRVAGFIKSLK